MEYEILLEKNDEFLEENNLRTIKRKKKEVKVMRRYAKAPVKMLVKARDMYVRGMNRLSDVTAPAGISVGHVSTLPRSFSANYRSRSVTVSDDKTMSELIRVASVRNMIITAQTEPESYNVTRRNFSAGIEKMNIGEDKVYEFGFVPRSKSYSVSKFNHTYALK